MADKPTEAEMEILSILWALKKATVREIHEKLAVKKDTGYTTTLKLLQLMLTKGLVNRDDQNRSHIYYPAIDQASTQQHMVKNLIWTSFGGSYQKLVLQALGQSKPSKEEIDEIRDFLDSLEEGNHGNL